MNEDLLSKKWIEFWKVGSQIQVLMKKARNLMISDKKEQFSYRNWCNFIVKNMNLLTSDLKSCHSNKGFLRKMVNFW